MKRLTRLVAGAGIALGLSAFAAPIAAGASGPAPEPNFGGGFQHPVFVQTDNLAGNQVVAYDRAPNGTLTLANFVRNGWTGRPAEWITSRPSRFGRFLDQ